MSFSPYRESTTLAKNKREKPYRVISYPPFTNGAIPFDSIHVLGEYNWYWRAWLAAWWFVTKNSLSMTEIQRRKM